MTGYSSISEIKAANEAAGYYFFEESALRFFHSRIGSTVYGGRYFITSETPDPQREPRCYTIREALPGGGVKTTGEFRQYHARQDAIKAARDLRGASVYFTQIAREGAEEGWTVQQIIDWTGLHDERDLEQLVQVLATVEAQVSA